jgi:hypothetical protein
MDITKFFNPFCTEHMKAFKVLSTTGCWPEGFVPEGTEFPSTWVISLYGKIADAWLREVEAGRINGVPGFDQ